MHSQRLFGLFIAIIIAFAVLLILLGVLNRVGMPGIVLQVIPAAFVLLAVAIIGYLCRTMRLPVFYVSGHSQEPIIAGGAAAGNISAAAIFLCLGGFSVSSSSPIEAICVAIIAGIALNGILVAPYIRKYGANTLPGFLSAVYDKKIEALATTILFAFCTLQMMLHFSLLVDLMDYFSSLESGRITLFILFIGLGITILSGVQGISWVGALVSGVLLISILILVANLGTASGGSYFPYFAQFHAAEILSLQNAGGSSQESSLISQLMLTLSLICAVMTNPQIITSITTIKRPELTLKAITWTAIILALLLVLFPALRIYFELSLQALIAEQAPGTIPSWALNLARDGIAQVCGSQELSRIELEAACNAAGGFSATTISFDEVVLLPVIPQLAGLPDYFSGIGFAFVVAALMAGFCFFLHQSAALLCEGVYLRFIDRNAPRGRQLVMARLIILSLGILLLLAQDFYVFDAEVMIYASFGLLASTILPLLILGIWFKNSSVLGALAGTVSGLVFSGVIIITTAPAPLGFGDPALFGLTYMNFGFAGFLLSGIVYGLISTVAIKQDREKAELVGKIRQAGGKTISPSAIDRWEG